MMVDRSLDRFSHGSLLAEKQGIQWMIADSAMELYQCKLMVLHAAYKIENERDFKTEVSMAKHFVANALWRIIDRAIQVHGALGYSTDTPLADMFKQARWAASPTAPTRSTRCASPSAPSPPTRTSARRRRPPATCRSSGAGLSVSRANLAGRLGLALDVEPREDAVEPVREPPVGLAQQLHGRRHQHHPHDGGIDEDGGGQAEAEQLGSRTVGRRR